MIKNTILTKEVLREKVPSIFATKPHSRASEKYVMFNSEQIIDDLAKLNYFPVSARQSRVRNDENNGTQRHEIRFRKPEHFDIGLNEVAPEFCWQNGHNTRVSAKGLLGLFRKICTNGLTVTKELFGGVTQRHVGIDFATVEEMIFNFAKESSAILEKVEDYKKLELSANDKRIFAEKAKVAIWPTNTGLNADALLIPRRDADFSNDLWTTFNVVQENVIKGGIQYQGQKRKTRTKGITSVEKDTNINLLLWGLLDSTYQSSK